MQVTRTNIKQQLPIILESIKKSQVVAFDFELSGIRYNEDYSNTSLDSVQARYWKLRYNVQKFAPLQLGICGFEIKDNKEILAYPFNIHICPFGMQNGQQKNFNVSASAFNFLDSHGFDYNRVFKDGVYFTSKNDIEYSENSQMVKQIKKQERKENPGALQTKAQIVFDEYKDKLKELFENSRKRSVSMKVGVHFNDFLCRNIKNLIKDNKINQNLYFEIEYKNKSYRKENVITVKKLSQQKQEELRIYNERKKFLLDRKDIPTSIPEDQELRSIFDYISKNNIPLISHNGIFDIMHLYDNFFEPLPDNVKTFQERLHKLFPQLYDTKFMLQNSITLNNAIRKNSTLRLAYEQLYIYNSRLPKIKLAEGFEDYNISKNDDSNKAHEGGYDSFITGFVFVQALKALKINHWTNFYQTNSSLEQQMKFFRNNIPLSGLRNCLRIEQDGNYEGSASGFFYLQFIGNKKLQAQEIKKYLSENYGNVQVYLTNDIKYELYFYFAQEEQKLKFMEEIKDGYKLFKIQELDCIVYTQEAIEQKAKGYLEIQNEQDRLKQILDEVNTI